MTKNIFEDLPARKHAPAAAAPSDKEGGKKEGGEGGSEKRIRQAVYDIRYRARREGISLEQAYSQYIANSNLSQDAKMRIKEALFPKGGDAQKEKEEAKESYTSIGIDLATTALSEAMYKVFVESSEETISEEELEKVYEEKAQPSEGKKYPVRVTDPQSGVTYHRTATRAKINELKAKGLQVEIDEYGEKSGKNYEGEDEKKEDKKEVKEALDPVGKEDDDVNNDGKVDDTDGYLKNRRGAIARAIAKNKKKVTEEFIGEVAMDQEDPTLEQLPIDVMIGKNKVKVAKHDAKAKNGMPMFESSLEKYMSMAKARLSGACPKCEKNPCECDTRDRKTELTLLKNKMRALGIKNPMMMNPPEGEDVMKVMTSSRAKMACEDTIVEKRRSDKEDPESDPNPKEGGKMKDDKAYQHVAGMIRDMQGRPKGQRKKKRGEKNEEGGKYSRMADRKKDLEDKAKKAGYKSKEDYLDAMARYGGEENRKKGRGLGS